MINSKNNDETAAKSGIAMITYPSFDEAYLKKSAGSNTTSESGRPSISLSQTPQGSQNCGSAKAPLRLIPQNPLVDNLRCFIRSTDFEQICMDSASSSWFHPCVAFFASSFTSAHPLFSTNTRWRKAKLSPGYGEFQKKTAEKIMMTQIRSQPAIALHIFSFLSNSLGSRTSRINLARWKVSASDEGSDREIFFLCIKLQPAIPKLCTVSQAKWFFTISHKMTSELSCRVSSVMLLDTNRSPPVRRKISENILAVTMVQIHEAWIMRETKKEDFQPFCTPKEVQVSVFGDEERSSRW